MSEWNFILAISAVVASAGAGSLGCSSDESPPITGAAGGGAGGGAAGAGGAAFCQTPANDTELFPELDFSGVIAVALTVPSCGEGPDGPVPGGPNGGGPNGGGPNGGVAPNGGGPSSAVPGGAGAPPAGGPSGPGGPGGGRGGFDDGAAPPAIIDEFPNEFGRVAQEQLATQLGIFAEPTFGTNGRFCETCHANQNDWSLTPSFAQQRFYEGRHAFSGNCNPLPNNDSAEQNDDLESLFLTVDASNSPLSDVSTPEARERAYSLLLSRALIRIGQAVPEDADFELVEVDDPYGFASAAELSLFRRTPSMANLRFNTTIMWDGREEVACSDLKGILRAQAAHAIEHHAEGEEPSEQTVDDMVETELDLYLAQLVDDIAGRLDEDGAKGGPVTLAQAPFYWGINAFEQTDPQGVPYNREVFNLYGAWQGLPADSERNRVRAAIAEGERLFNSKEFTIRGVSGFNDVLGRAELTGTCGSCHNTPNVGTNSEGRLMDIGVSDEARRTPDLPLYTFREKESGALLSTTDPGQALFTKRFSHMNRFKVPNLRGVVSRPPYLHNGAAPSLAAVVDYHDQRFDIRLTGDESSALVAFLSAL
jgi:cytochrome c peroxidase